MPPQTTDSSSLSSIEERIAAKFSAPVEENAAPTPPPEPTPSPASESQQAPAAPSEPPEASEQADVPASEASETEPPQPPKYTVKIDGKDHEVTLDDLLKGYSFTEHNTRKSQQLAEEKKALEAERQKFLTEETATLRQKRDQYDTYLAQLSDALQAMTPKEPDWDALRARVTPDVFAAEVLNWQQNKQHLERVEAEQRRVKAEKDAEAQQGFQQYLRAQQEKLEAAIPAFKDPEHSKAFKAQLKEFGVSQYGFSPEEFSAVTDARLVLLLNDARQFHEGKAKAPAIENKIEKVLATSQPGSRTTSAPKNELAEAQARARKSGKADDVAEVIRLKFSRKA